MNGDDVRVADALLELRKRLTNIERRLVAEECYNVAALRRTIDKMHFERQAAHPTTDDW